MTHRDSADWRWLLAIAGGVLIVYLSLMPRFIERLNPLTGDEPYYVMTVISMVRDRDLDEANNYENRDYDEFYPATPLPSGWDGWPAFPTTLPPHPAVTELDGLHTKHGLGLSVLIAIPYELLGRIGAMLVVLICGAGLAGQMFLLGRDAGANPLLATVVSAGIAVSMPVAPYALLLFPEVPAALLLLYAVRRIASPSNSIWQWLLAGASVGFLPWLHQRFVPSAVLLAAVVAWRLLKPPTRAGTLVALLPVSIGGLSLLAYNWWMYRSPVQNMADHAGFSGFSGTLNGAYGLLLDAQWGLLIAAPVLAIALAAIPRWLTADRPTAALALAVIAPYLLMVAVYRVWWGEWGPPARYLVPIVPLAAGPLSAWIRSASIPGRLITAGLWAVGFALTIVGFADPQRFYHQPNGWNNLWARLDMATGLNVAERLIAFQPFALAPSYDRATAALVLTAIMLVVLTLMYFPLLFRFSSKRQPIGRTEPVDPPC